MMSKSTAAVQVAAFALLAVAIGGCTQRQQSSAQSTPAPVSQPAAVQPTVAAGQATAAAAQPAASAAADATAQPQSATPVAAALANASLGSSDGDQPGTKFVIDSLLRGSDTLTLKFTLVNDSAKELSSTRFNGSGYVGYRSMSGVHLIDTVSKKKYFPIADTDGNCVCSNNVDDIASNSQVALWVKFPAPPASVKKITVEVPHFIPLDDVPIAQ